MIKHLSRLMCIIALASILNSCLIVSVQKEPLNKSAPPTKRTSYNLYID